MRASQADVDCTETAQKLEQYLDVAKGEINRLDYIITQFLQAIRPVTAAIEARLAERCRAETLDAAGAGIGKSRADGERKTCAATGR